jgi:hypothetical protein
LRTRQLVCGAPTRDPCFHFIKGDRESGPLEFVVAAAVLSDVRTFEIYNRIEECHGFG